ncbi:biotin transporter BioY [Aliibacillus thermotolerans]|uniref:Biotin transporter n=1 Tax=Aliibacillus thermotolerans TaxID=1834418 RepID=A0ABW0UBP1_9BACI|nr:biotin transporter BioY [Aliibacillus thermotolerans]MDA3129714.1 BioY family transporter [Aliibacillus thermotolerans]
MHWKPIQLIYAALFAALMGIGANVTSYLVIGGVPITLQSIIAIIAGALLGSRLGALSMTIYALVGLVGMPVFAGFSGGVRALVSPTFGFILSFIVVAFVVGKMIEKKKKIVTSYAFFVAFIGLALNYMIGTNYMYFAYLWIADAPDGFSYSMVWLWMALPLVKDIILTILTAVSIPKLLRMRTHHLAETKQTAS